MIGSICAQVLVWPIMTVELVVVTQGSPSKNVLKPDTQKPGNLGRTLEPNRIFMLLHMRQVAV